MARIKICAVRDRAAIEAAAAGRGVALAKRAIAAADLASGRLVAPFADGSHLIDFGYWIAVLRSYQ